MNGRITIDGQEQSDKLVTRLFKKYGRRGLKPRKDSYVADSDLRRLKRDYGLEPNEGYFIFFKAIARNRTPWFPPSQKAWKGAYRDDKIVSESGASRDARHGCGKGLHVTVTVPTKIDYDESCIAVLVHQNDIAAVPISSAGNQWAGSRKIRVRQLRVLGLVRRRDVDAIRRSD